MVRKRNALTSCLLIALIGAKFALGTVAYLDHIADRAGFGEIMVMIAIMIAVQAEIVHRRAQTLVASIQQVAQPA